MTHLVIDVGTSSVRAAIIRPDATITNEHRAPFLPSTPYPGAVEFDAVALAAIVIDLATRVLSEVKLVDGIGVTNQRASTIVWDRATGEPVAPALGWQDLRTAGTSIMLRAQGFTAPPNASAGKLSFLLDMVDFSRSRDLCFGTVDSWLVWTLTGGATARDARHVIEASNAGLTALVVPAPDGSVMYDDKILSALNIPYACLPSIVDSSGFIGEAIVLPGAPRILGIAGDQQASLMGMGCVHAGQAKITFGTGAMLDMCLGSQAPASVDKGPQGTIPIVTRQVGGTTMWGLEAIMLSAGTAVEWLRDDLGIVNSAAESSEVAARCESTGGVVFVPALMGLGTPTWDFGARGTLLGITRGTGRAEVVRAVLEGVAHRGADLVDAAVADSGLVIEALRIDGGMSVNPVFMQALADATQRRVEASPVVEATALGAGFLAGLAAGTWSSLSDVAATWKPSTIYEPNAAKFNERDRWFNARERSRYWIEGMSALAF